MNSSDATDLFCNNSILVAYWRPLHLTVLDFDPIPLLTSSPANFS